MISIRAALLGIVALAFCAVVAAEPAGNFPRPPELEPDILFWTRVYTEVDTRAGLIHDSKHLGIVYEVLRFPEGAGPRTQRRLVKAAKQRYKTILSALARGKRDSLSDDEARVLALWPDNVGNRTLRAATRRLRFQLGQSDKFRAGLARSGIWEAHIREILSGMGLPQELVALPHVESSFNPKARSRVGAAGMWQFTRSTGRRFMRIDRSVDERMDPYLSTVAAAKLLSHNYAATGTWPLAITSYNHGTAGMRRAARKLGTKDITRIVRNYRSRRFGFASRNFYVAFLAAVEIHFNPDKYFDMVPRHSAPPTQLVRVPDYMSIDTLQRVLDIDRDVLREFNPALRPSIWRGAKYVPRGFELRIPASAQRDEMLAALSRIGEDERYGTQLRDRYYKVRRGNTLAGIAKHFEVDIDDLVAINGLKSRHRIRAGQVLALPLPDGVKVDASVRVPPDAPAAARPEPTLVAENGRYRVRRGDSVWLIARRLGVDEETLVSLNALGDGERILVGQVLRVEPEKPEAVTIASAGMEGARGGVEDTGMVPRKPMEKPATLTTAAAGAESVGGGVEDTGVVPGKPAPVTIAAAGVESTGGGVEDTGVVPGKPATLTMAAAGAERVGGGVEDTGVVPRKPATVTIAAAGVESTGGGAIEDTGVVRVEPAPVIIAAAEPENTGGGVEDIGELPATVPAAPTAGESTRVTGDAAIAAATATEVAAVDPGTPPPALAEAVGEFVEDDTPVHVSDGLIARVEQAEPVSAEEAEEIAPALPLTVQPDLSADPSDYSVVADDSIEVQAAETLGHYADWLELRAWRLRHLNGMRYGQPVVIGQRLSLDFSRVSATEFEHRRIAYHQALQESFFKRYRIAGTSTHVVRRGESLWILARRRFEIPLWLLRQYNPDLDFDSVDIGVTLTVPQLER